jgi:hypothetical protein
MMIFHAFGHKNVLAKHKTTIEFTHEEHMTLRGDCILGVKADYSLGDIKKQGFQGRICIMLNVGELTDAIEATYNPSFNNPEEMVIRTSKYVDQRTFATNATKAGKDINRDIIKKLQDPATQITITVTQKSPS